jgi:hypothetical protein
MKILILTTDAGDSGACGTEACHCAAVELTAEILELCGRRVELAEAALAKDPSLEKLCFQDSSGPKFFGDDLLAACAECSDDFHDDFVNNGSAVLPAGITLEGHPAGRVDALLMVVWRFQYRDLVAFEVGWTAVPEEASAPVVTEAIPLDYLKQVMEGEARDSRCECELPGYFHSGVPGIIAHVENGRLAAGAAVERCDLCRRYESDEAALAKLRELGIA